MALGEGESFAQKGLNPTNGSENNQTPHALVSWRLNFCTTQRTNAPQTPPASAAWSLNFCTTAQSLNVGQLKIVKKLKLHEAKACGVCRYFLGCAVVEKLRLHDAKACGV
jgi:hypothetical protein